MDDEVDAGDGNAVAVAVWPKTKCERVRHTLTHIHTYTHTHTCSRSVCMRCLPPAFPKDARVKQRDSAGGASTEKFSKLHSEDKGGTLITRQGVNGVGRGKGGKWGTGNKRRARSWPSIGIEPFC